jgi:hypothetical protein
MLRLELLNVKADLERELGRLVPTAPRADNGFIGSRVLPRLRATGHIESQPARGAGGLGGLIEQTDAARPNEQARDDENDAKQHPTAHERHDAGDSEDRGDDPEDQVRRAFVAPF